MTSPTDLVAEWADCDPALGIWIECEKGTYRVVALALDERIKVCCFCRESELHATAIYVCCDVDRIIGWTFGSTFKSNSCGSRSATSDDKEIAYSIKELRPMRELEKVMIGPGEPQG